jgi:hypothetical protein
MVGARKRWCFIHPMSDENRRFSRVTREMAKNVMNSVTDRDRPCSKAPTLVVTEHLQTRVVDDIEVDTDETSHTDQTERSPFLSLAKHFMSIVTKLQKDPPFEELSKSPLDLGSAGVFVVDIVSPGALNTFGHIVPVSSSQMFQGPQL